MIPDPNPQPTRPIDKLNYRRHLRVFPVQAPVTLFVRGSQCKVTVGYHELDHVEIYASLYAAFGMRLVIEQDEAGVYVVVRRRRLWGVLSRSEVMIRVPFYCRLALNLTPGDVQLQYLHGTLEIPPFAQQQSANPLLSLEPNPEVQLSAPTSPRLGSGE